MSENHKARDRLKEVRLICFDVNETLLDMSVLDAGFALYFGTAEARQMWFLVVQEIALTSVITGNYSPFSELCQSGLQMLALRKGVNLESADLERTLAPMRSAPAFPDVAPALSALRQAGFRVVALTNGELSPARTQLGDAGIADSFDAILSADETRCLKPGREPYEMAAKRMSVAPAQMLMVAAHAWDLAGAAAAGCATAFVARPGKALNPSASNPDVIARKLSELVVALPGIPGRQAE